MTIKSEHQRSIGHSEMSELAVYLNKPCEVLGWILPLPLLDGGWTVEGGWGSLAERCTRAGALPPALVIVAGAVPGISILELSLEELSVCWSSAKISRISPAIECSSDVTCLDNWSILAFTSSNGRPGPLWKLPKNQNLSTFKLNFCFSIFTSHFLSQG